MTRRRKHRRSSRRRSASRCFSASHLGSCADDGHRRRATVEVPVPGRRVLATRSAPASARCTSRARPSRSGGRSRAPACASRWSTTRRALWKSFSRLRPARGRCASAPHGLGRVRYRHVDRRHPRGAPPRARRPGAGVLARIRSTTCCPRTIACVFLHALYDITLRFEHSPLLGCTSFAFGPAPPGRARARRARVRLRGGRIFDATKAVFLVREDGRLPFASVAWPGLVGVVTGMNAEGVVAAWCTARARGSRARTASRWCSRCARCWPRAHTADEARRDPRHAASHGLAPRDGRRRERDGRVVERAPGAGGLRARGPRRRSGSRTHFEGPLAKDPGTSAYARPTTTTPAPPGPRATR